MKLLLTTLATLQVFRVATACTLTFSTLRTGAAAADIEVRYTKTETHVGLLTTSGKCYNLEALVNDVYGIDFIVICAEDCIGKYCSYLEQCLVDLERVCPDSLPPKWEKHVDAKTGNTLYYNTETKKTQWLEAPVSGHTAVTAMNLAHFKKFKLAYASLKRMIRPRFTQYDVLKCPVTGELYNVVEDVEQNVWPCIYVRKLIAPKPIEGSTKSERIPYGKLKLISVDLMREFMSYKAKRIKEYAKILKNENVDIATRPKKMRTYRLYIIELLSCMEF